MLSLICICMQFLWKIFLQLCLECNYISYKNNCPVDIIVWFIYWLIILLDDNLCCQQIQIRIYEFVFKWDYWIMKRILLIMVDHYSLLSSLMCWIQGGDRPGELTLSRCVLVGSDLKSNNDSMFAIVCLQSKNVVPNMVTPNCIITGEECRGMHSFYPATDKLPLLSNPQEWIALWCNIVYADQQRGIPTHDPSVCPMRWLTSCYYTKCQSTLPPLQCLNVFQVFLKHCNQLKNMQKFSGL